jgi:hypothetical protein
MKVVGGLVEMCRKRDGDEGWIWLKYIVYMYENVMMKPSISYNWYMLIKMKKYVEKFLNWEKPSLFIT